MDNHAVIDLARTIFDFGAPGFWELIHDVRYSALDAAAGHGVPLLVTTFCYAEPEDREQFGQFEAIVQRHGGGIAAGLPALLARGSDAAGRQSRPGRAAQDNVQGKR